MYIKYIIYVESNYPNTMFSDVLRSLALDKNLTKILHLTFSNQGYQTNE